MEWILNGGGVPVVIGEYTHRQSLSEGTSKKNYGSYNYLSGDALKLAASEMDNGRVFIYTRDSENSEFTLSQILTLPSGQFGFVGAISHDGTYLAVGSTDSSAGVVVYELQGSGLYVEKQRLAIGPNFPRGKLTMSKDGGLLLGYISGGAAVHVYRRQTGGLYDYVGVVEGVTDYFGHNSCISDDNKWLFCTDYRVGEVHVFKVDDLGIYQLVQVLTDGAVLNGSYGGSVDCSADGGRLIVGQSSVNRVHYFTRGMDNKYTLKQTLSGGTGRTFFGGVVILSRSNDRLFVGHYGISTVRIYDLTGDVYVESQDRLRYTGNFGVGLAVGFEGGTLVVGGDPEKVHIFKYG